MALALETSVLYFVFSVFVFVFVFVISVFVFVFVCNQLPDDTSEAHAKVLPSSFPPPLVARLLGDKVKKNNLNMKKFARLADKVLK